MHHHHAHIDDCARSLPMHGSSTPDLCRGWAVLSSAGVTAGLDLALHVDWNSTRAAVAAEVARGSGGVLAPVGKPIRRFHRGYSIATICTLPCIVCQTRWLANRLVWTSNELSAVACTSPRNLARFVAEHAHCSPLDYVQLIRFAFAKELVTQSKLDLERVAARAVVSVGSAVAAGVARWNPRRPACSGRWHEIAGRGAGPRR